jgi:UDP-glucose 4-epimerase
MKGVIFGGAGFVGSNLVNTLRDIDWVVVDDLSLGVRENITGKHTFIEGSIADDLAVRQALREGADFVMLMNGLSSNPMYYPDPRKGVQSVVMGALNVFDTCRKLDISQVIYASTSSLYGKVAEDEQVEGRYLEPPNFYSAARRCVEDYSRLYWADYGISSVGWRYFSIYGENEAHKGKYANCLTQFVWDMLKGKQPAIYGNGEQTRDFIHVSDIVKANKLAIDLKPEGANVYNVGTGVSHSFNDVITEVNKHLPKKVDPLYVKNQIHNYVFKTKADVTKIAEELGFKADVTFEEGVKRTVKHYS